MLSLHLSNPHIWPKLDCKKSNGLGVELFLAAAYKRAAWANQGPKGMLPILYSLTMPSIVAPCAPQQEFPNLRWAWWNLTIKNYVDEWKGEMEFKETMSNSNITVCSYVL